MSFKKYFTKQSIKSLLKEAKSSHELERTLGPLQLVLLGLGAIVGAGIFVFAGSAAGLHAGPSVVLSFILGALACSCAGLCYAELSSMIPISGGAYTFAYAALGEIIAWLAASMAMLICIFGAAAVAGGWSGYLVSLLGDYGIHIPPQLCYNLGHAITLTDGSIVYGICNLPALFIVMLVALILHKGTEASAMINAIIVAIKMVALTMFIIIGSFYIKPENWVPFIPENTGVFGEFGISGIIQGAAVVLIAYSGFDVVATAAQETKNPQKNLPIGILGSLAISAIVYSMIAAVLTGIVKYDSLNVPQPVALAIEAIKMPWFSVVIKISAVVGLTSVVLALVYAAVRVIFTITHDGLLPKKIATLHKKHHTPHYLTFGVGIIVSIMSSLFSTATLAQMSSFGVSTTFAIVCLSTIALRYHAADVKREFKCPFSLLIPLLGFLLFGSLMVVSLLTIYKQIFAWVAFTFVIYFSYSQHHSLLLKKKKAKA